MDGFEDFYVNFFPWIVIFPKKNIIIMYSKILNLQYIPFVYWYWIEVIFGLNVLTYNPYTLYTYPRRKHCYFLYAFEFKYSLKSFVCKSNSGQHKLNEGLNQQIILKWE